jgi:hypothetical protein
MLQSGRSQMKVDQLILVAQVLEAAPNDFLQQEPVIINKDNAKMENGSGALLTAALLLSMKLTRK